MMTDIKRSENRFEYLSEYVSEICDHKILFSCWNSGHSITYVNE